MGIGLYRLYQHAIQKMRAGRAPEPASGGGPDGAVRGEAKVGDVVVGDVGVSLVVFGDKACFPVNDIEPGLSGGIDEVSFGILHEAASQAGTHVDIGIYLRGGIAEGAQPVRRKTPVGFPVPFVEADSFPGNYPKAAVTVFQKVRDPVGAVQVPGFYLLLGERTGETVFVQLFSVLPDLPAGAVPKAHVHGAFPVFVEAGDAVIGLPDPHLSGVVFQ